MHRRTFIQSLSALPLFGCLNGCANSPLGKTILSLGDIALGTGNEFDADYVNKLPYASIIVTRTNKKRALLVLGKVEGKQLHWFSSDRSVLVTQNGRLMRTVGLDENLVDTRILSQDYSEDAQGLSPLRGTSRGKRSLDIQPGNRFGILVESTIEPSRQEKISILDQNFDTTLWVETNHAKSLNWTFQNRYWANNEGFVLKSFQQISPKQPPVIMEVAKRYLGLVV